MRQRLTKEMPKSGLTGCSTAFLSVGYQICQPASLLASNLNFYSCRITKSRSVPSLA